MAFGGGIFTSQNKKLPGTYINFVTAATAAAEAFGRGVAAIGLNLSWGADNKIISVTAEEFRRNALALFGHSYDKAELKGLRDIFRHAHTVRVFRLNSGGAKASNSLAEAICSGVRGNDITISVAANVDKPGKYDVMTWIDGEKVDSQTVASAADLKPNAFVSFKTFELAEKAGEKLTGGTDGTATVESHQKFIDLIQSYSFNAIGAVSDETKDGAVEVNALYAAFAIRMRDEMGVKFQAVLYRHPADHEAVVNVKNAVSDTGESAASLVYWATGLMAGTRVGQSAMNTVYDGEFEVDAGLTQAELEAAIDAGEFTLHRVNDELRVLNDVNSLITYTDSKGPIFSKNQTIRIADAIAMETAAIFNTKYIGKVNNNASGRVSLWADIVKIMRDLERIGAVEGFDEGSVAVEQGEKSGAVAARIEGLNIAGAMEQLYMTVVFDS